MKRVKNIDCLPQKSNATPPALLNPAPSSPPSPFTLIEILAVIVIIVFLVGTIVGVTSLVHTKTATSKTEAMIKKLEMAAESFKQKNGYYPPQVTGAKGGNLYVGKDPPTTTDFGYYFDFTAMKANDLKSDASPPAPFDTGTTATNPQYYVLDAYGNPLRYKCPGGESGGTQSWGNPTKFDIVSWGSDGYPGNSKTTTTDTGRYDDICNFKR